MIASGAYGMAVGDKDYDWTYHTVCFLWCLVVLFTLCSGPPTKSEWSRGFLFCVRAALLYFRALVILIFHLFLVGDYSEDQVV